MITKCVHDRWCKGTRDAHDPTCPTEVLRLSDDDVDAFCAQHMTIDPPTESCDTHMLHATHLGRVARIGVVGSEHAWRFARRWLAEAVLMHAKMETK